MLQVLSSTSASIWKDLDEASGLPWDPNYTRLNDLFEAKVARAAPAKQAENKETKKAPEVRLGQGWGRVGWIPSRSKLLL